MPDDQTPQDGFIGVSGFFGAFLKFGFAGIIAGAFLWLLAVEIPRQQTIFRDELKAEREVGREQAEKSREHGNRAVKELSESVKEQTRAIQEQSQNLNWSQTMIQTAIESQLELQKKSMKKDTK